MHKNAASNISIRMLGFVEHLGLLIITIATIIAGFQEVTVMIAAAAVTLADLLLLFLYLEILAMVGQYFETGKLPVRYPIYIAIVALARYLVLDMKNLDQWQLIGVASGILLLALSVMAIGFTHARFPYRGGE